jgi:hypothetical protein
MPLRPPWLACTFLVLAALAPASADAAPKPCAPGKATVLIGGSRTCQAPTAKLLPAAHSSATLATALAGSLLRGEPDAFLQRLRPLPPQLRARNRHERALARLAPQLDPATRRLLPAPRAPLADGWTFGSVRDATSPAASERSTSATWSELGGRATLTMELRTPADASGQAQVQAQTLDVTLAGSGASFSISLGINDGVEFEDPCPTAAGELRASERARVRQVKSEKLLDGHFREAVRLEVDGTYRGSVGPDARLQQIAFETRVLVEAARSGSALRGFVRSAGSVTITIAAAGTMDRSGAVSFGRLEVAGRGRGTGEVSQAEFDALLRTPAATEAHRRLVADLLASGHRRFLAAEEIWRGDGRCAKVTFDPASATLAPGATAAIAGRVTAKRDGAPSEGRWPLPTMERGGLVGGLPGSSTPAAGVSFSVRGAEPDAQRRTAAFTITATSRAGIASATWSAQTAGWRVTLRGAVETNFFGGLPGNKFKSTVSATLVVQPQLIAGAMHTVGIAPTQHTDLVLETEICAFTFDSAGGTVAVEAFDAPNGTVRFDFVFQDRGYGTGLGTPDGCPVGPISAPMATWAHVAGVASVTVPARGGDASMAWDLPLPANPLPSRGALAVRVDPL